MRQSNTKKICIIIPAYNEQTSITSVIRQLQEQSKNFHLVVINDGSTDLTSSTARALQVTVVDLPFNLGIGGAVQTGLHYARDNGFSIAIQTDADGQHPPSEIPKLLAALDSNVDMVIGSRYLHKTSYTGATYRTWGISFFSFLIHLLCGQKIYDSTSGFRAYNTRAIHFLASHYPIDFPEPESIVQMLKNNLTIREVSVEMKERMAGQSSIRSLKALYLTISIVIGIILSALKKKTHYAAVL